MPEEGSTTDVVELTRRVYAALRERRFDALLGMFGETSVWDVSRWGLGTHVGLRAIRQFLDDWFGSLERYELNIEEMHDLGEGIVFVVVEQVAHRAGDEGELRVRSAPVFMWAQEKLALVTVYPSIGDGRAAALRAAMPSSRRKIELHERIIESIGAREVPEALLAPDFRIESRVTAATDYSYVGAAGLSEWQRDLFESFAGEPRLAIEAVIVASDEFVVARFCASGPASQSTETVELRWVGVMWFQADRATRAVGFNSRDDALRAVGMAG